MNGVTILLICPVDKEPIFPMTPNLSLLENNGRRKLECPVIKSARLVQWHTVKLENASPLPPTVQ